MKTENQIHLEMTRLSNLIFNSWTNDNEFQKERIRGKIEVLNWVLKNE